MTRAAFTQRHFEIIAGAIFRLPGELRHAPAELLADALEPTNTRFKREAFISLCTEGPSAPAEAQP